MYICREVIGSLYAHVLWQQNSINHFALRHEHLYELHHNSARVCEDACDTCVLLNYKLISAFLLVHWVIHIHQTASILSLCITVAKTDFPSRINTVMPELPWRILSQRRQPTENLGYLNHCTSSSSSILCGLHWTKIFVQVRVDGHVDVPSWSCL
jgi:hypothetical protein